MQVRWDMLYYEASSIFWVHPRVSRMPPHKMSHYDTQTTSNCSCQCERAAFLPFLSRYLRFSPVSKSESSSLFKGNKGAGCFDNLSLSLSRAHTRWSTSRLLPCQCAQRCCLQDHSIFPTDFVGNRKIPWNFPQDKQIFFKCFHWTRL